MAFGTGHLPTVPAKAYGIVVRLSKMTSTLGHPFSVFSKIPVNRRILLVALVNFGACEVCQGVNVSIRIFPVSALSGRTFLAEDEP